MQFFFLPTGKSIHYQQYRKQAMFLRPNLSNFSQAPRSIHSRGWGALRPCVSARRWYSGHKPAVTLMGNDDAEHFLSHRMALNWKQASSSGSVHSVTATSYYILFTETSRHTECFLSKTISHTVPIIIYTARCLADLLSKHTGFAVT